MMLSDESEKLLFSSLFLLCPFAPVEQVLFMLLPVNTSGITRKDIPYYIILLPMTPIRNTQNEDHNYVQN